MTPFHLAAKLGHFLLLNSLINIFSNGLFWLLNGVESKICRGLHFTTAYITEIDQFKRPYEAKYSSLKNHKNSPYSHDKNYNGIQPATKPSENKVGWPQMHLGKVTILHISLRSIAEYFTENSLRSFGKIFCKHSLRSFGKRSHFTGPILQLSLRSTFAKLF